MPPEAGNASAGKINHKHVHSYDTLAGSSRPGVEQAFETSECHSHPLDGLDPLWDLPSDWETFGQAPFATDYETGADNAWSSWYDLFGSGLADPNAGLTRTLSDGGDSILRHPWSESERTDNTSMTVSTSTYVYTSSNANGSAR